MSYYAFDPARPPSLPMQRRLSNATADYRSEDRYSRSEYRGARSDSPGVYSADSRSTGIEHGLLPWQLELFSSQRSAWPASGTPEETPATPSSGSSSTHDSFTTTLNGVRLAASDSASRDRGQRCAAATQTPRDDALLDGSASQETAPRPLKRDETPFFDVTAFMSDEAYDGEPVRATVQEKPLPFDAHSRSTVTVDAESDHARRPVMRSASLSWETPRGDVQRGSSFVTDSSQDAKSEASRITSIAIVADPGDVIKPVSARPPPIGPLVDYAFPPLLLPVEDDESNSKSTGSAMSKPFEFNEKVLVTYHSGESVERSKELKLCREHFLSGHNVMAVVSNTPRCSCLAEDLLSTMITATYADAQDAGDAIINELSIAAYGVRTMSGLTQNLLPVSVSESVLAPKEDAANPICGLIIGNYPPVSMLSASQTRYLARGLVHNARAIGAEPWSEPYTIIYVTLLLKQSRLHASDVSQQNTVSHSQSSSRTGTTSSPQTGSDPFVYVSSMHLVFTGHNLQSLDELLEMKAPYLWPLFRHAFGGQCHTAMVVMADDSEGLSRTQPLLSLTQKRARTTNRAPHSGSVTQFLQSIASRLAMGESINHQYLQTMQGDAQRLLTDTCADIPFYSPTGLPVFKGFRRAHDILLLEIPRPAAAPETAPVPQAPELAPIKSMSVLAESTNTITADSSLRSSSSVKAIHIPMPSTVRAREQAARALASMRRQRSRESAEAPPELRQSSNGAARASTPVSSQELVGTVDAASTSAVERAAADAVSSATSYGSNHTLSVVLVDTHGVAGAGDGSAPPLEEWVVRRLDNNHVSMAAGGGRNAAASVDLSTSRSANSNEHSDLARCRFRADEVLDAAMTTAAHVVEDNVTAATGDQSAQLEALLPSLHLNDIGSAFIEEERNVAILSTDCVAGVQPFIAQPVWGIARLLINSALQTNRVKEEQPGGAPWNMRIYMSLLEGSTIVRDLSVDPVGQPSEPLHASIAASPLFGSLLYLTGSVDLDMCVDSGEVLSDMLERADETAGSRVEPYIVFTCVQKTAYTVKEEELSDVDRTFGYHYDATFSSFTVVSTRNSTQVYQDGVMRDAKQFPIDLITDAIHGSTQTVALLHVDSVLASRQHTLDALLLHNRLQNAPKQQPRVGRVRGYLEECWLSMDRLQRQRDESQSATADERRRLSERIHALDTMIKMHEVFLKSNQQNGYILYPQENVAPASVPSPVPQRATDGAAAVPGHALAASSLVSSSVHTTATADGLMEGAELRQVGSAAMQLRTFPSKEGSASTDAREERSPPTLRDETLPMVAGARGVSSRSPVAQPTADAADAPPKNADALRSTDYAPKRQPTPQLFMEATDTLKSSSSQIVEVETREERLRAARTAEDECQQRRLTDSAHAHGPAPSSLPDPSPPAAAAAAGVGAERSVSPTVRVDALSPKPVDPSAGVTVHSALLFRHLNLDSARVTPGCMEAVSPRRGELQLVSATRDTMKAFRFDEVVELYQTGPPPQPTNTVSLGECRVLRTALNGFLAGSNSAIILQSTLAAEAAQLMEGLLVRAFRSCLASKPPETEFFFSATFVGTDVAQCVDLLQADQDAVPLKLGFSPLTGPLILSSRLRPLETVEDATTALMSTLRADRALGAVRGRHLVFLSLVQKTVVEAERDVSVSSLLIILGRHGAGVMREIGACKELAHLMRYALAGPCYTLCCSAITDREPDHGYDDVDMGNEMNGTDRVGVDDMLEYQQNTLSEVAGKPIIYNSYVDLLKHHTHRLGEIVAALRDAEDAADPRKLAALKSSKARLERMIKDDKRILAKNGLPGQPPPTYPM